MRQNRKRPALLALTGLVASLLVLAPAGTANAAESIPALQISPAPTVPALLDGSLVESSDGSVTLPCSMETGHGESDLVTYGPSGGVVRQIPRSPQIDGVPNCITTPVADKNGDLYGFPWGRPSPGASTVYGPNLLAYDGNTLKWKYPARCGSSTNETPMTVGADGNIYVLTDVNGNIRLLGLAPELAAGQTQPAVKVDIDVPNSCFAQLLPYRDGIIVRPQSGSVQHYSYTGSQVSARSIPSSSQGVVNHDGVFFTPKWVTSGSVQQTNVVATHPAQGGVWDLQVSTPGANVQDIQVYALAGGGVVALIREQKMYQGFPAIPTEYIWTLTVLGSGGQLIQREYLPNTAGTTNLGQPYVMTDGGGKVIVLRDITVPSGQSWPSTMPGIAIGVYNPATDSWVYQEAMTGDNNAQGGPYGYRLEWKTSKKVAALTGDTVTFVSRCAENCPPTGFRKLYALDVSGVSTVYPKSRIESPTQRPAAGYIALGDSFSSGEGVPSFEATTAVANVNTCHRSTVAYARLLEGEGDIPSLGSDGFRACSGAVTTNITDLGQWNEGIQIDRTPDTSTQVVTLTIGGNDIGFATFAEACVLSTCQVGTSAYNTAVNKINNELPAKLKATYEKVLAYAPNAEVYVVGYPQVVANKAPTDGQDIRCVYMRNSGPNSTGSPYYPWEDAWAARDIVTKLNAKILAKVNEVDPTQGRLHFIDATASGSPFLGHEVCGTESTSYFQNVDQGGQNNAYALHPNALGQEAYAELIQDYIAAH